MPDPGPQPSATTDPTARTRDGKDTHARDRDLLISAARQASEIAMAHWRNSPETWEKPGDEGPVTEADIAVDQFLRETLLKARPDYGWLSEETPDVPGARSAEVVFIVDPIDGTRAFMKGEETWAHALTVVENGVPVAGVVYLPAKDKLYAAARGLGATLNGVAIAVAPPPGSLDTANMLTTKPNLAPHLWQAPVPRLTRHFRPSLAYRMALVAEGRFDGMITLRNSWDWDVAAGTLLIAEAGGIVTDRNGAAARFNTSTRQSAGVIGAPEKLHSEIVARLITGAAIS